MNVVVWWFVLLLVSWVLAAYVLYGTNMVVSAEEEDEAEIDEGRGE